MRGVKSEDLQAILDFLYCGEANVFQEDLDSFLSIAEELQLEGLTGKADDAEFEKSAPVKEEEELKSNLSTYIIFQNIIIHIFSKNKLLSYPVVI